jgi:DNA-binding MarR family transcriptional regulator
METLCKIREIYRSILEFETAFQRRYDLGLNEGMLLCTLFKSGRSTSGEIASCLGLTCSNTSKVIVSVEKKKLIRRSLGDSDKRQMRFSLTEKGKTLLETIRQDGLEIPDLLKTVLSSAEA